MSEEAVLVYFNGRGRGEIIRMVMCAANIKFKEVNLYERAEMLKLIADGELPFHAVPLLKVDGLKIVQTNAIIRYLTGKAGLDGKNATEKAWVDMYFEGSRDLYMPFMDMLYRDVEVVKAEVEAILPKFLPTFNKVLEKSSSGFLVGEKLTLADLGLMEALLSITDYFGADKMADYPLLRTYYTKMCSIGCIHNYIKSIRKPPNSESGVRRSRRILAMKEVKALL